METCYKAFTRKVLDSLTLKCNRFGFEPEFTSKVAKRKFRIYEVPISYSGRDYTEGKKNRMERRRCGDVVYHPLSAV